MSSRTSALPEPSRASDDRALLEAALGGDDAALRALVDRVTPVVQVRVARALRRRRHGARGRDVRQELEDLTQDVFLALFERGGRALRAWDPDRGLGLMGFVGFLAEREVALRMRSARRNPWTEDPTEASTLERTGGPADAPQGRTEAREMLSRLFDELQRWLTPEGHHYFQLLYVEERPVAEAAQRAGTTTAALYAWRSRLGKRMRQVRDELAWEGERHG